MEHRYQIGDIVWFNNARILSNGGMCRGKVVGYPDYFGDVTIEFEGQRYGRMNSEVILCLSVDD